MINQLQLKTFLNYDQETGIFTWIKGRLKHKNAGNFHTDGYIKIRINKKLYVAQKLAFLYMTGSFPENEVDHINRIKHDNKWKNLRECKRYENMKNRALQSNNKSGIKGVSFDKENGKWKSQIAINGKQKTLGRFSSKKLAGEAYKRASLENDGEYSLYRI